MWQLDDEWWCHSLLSFQTTNDWQQWQLTMTMTTADDNHTTMMAGQHHTTRWQHQDVMMMQPWQHTTHKQHQRRWVLMSMHWFYARGLGISHISTLTQIFLDLCTTDIPCDLIWLHKPSEVFNTLMFSRSEYPADMSTISEDFIMCSHITHHYTFKYLTQATHTLQHIRRTFAGIHTNLPSHFRSFWWTVPHLRILSLPEAHLPWIFGIIHTHPADCL